MSSDAKSIDTSCLSRRQFLKSASAAALISTLHPDDLFGDDNSAARDHPSASGSAHRELSEPRITSLRLFTAAPFSSLKEFYQRDLEFPLLSETSTEITFRGGMTPITFIKAPSEMGAPWYHVAFNIPENKLLSARTWQLERSPLIPTPPRAVDPDYPDDVRYFPRWNSHALFFWDPAGNLLEYIARHELPNRAEGPFTSADILYASEIGFVVDEQSTTARHLNQDLGLNVYPKATKNWWAMGDELGLLLCVPKRLWGENTDNPKRFAVFPTEATIRGSGRRIYQISNYPYKVTVS